MAAAAVLGMQQVRTPFLDDIRIGSRRQACGSAARHPRRDDSGAHSPEAGRRGGVRRGGRDRRGEGVSFGAEPLIPMRASYENLPADDDLEDEEIEEEDEEIEDEEDDDEDEEVWQVRLT
jgi:hypothetical protein